MPERHVGHRHAPRRAAGRVDGDAAVHLLVGDVDPVAAEPDLGPLVGRAVEVLGEGPGDVGRHDPGVLGMDRRGAVLDQVAEDRVELGAVVGADRRSGRSSGRPGGRRSGTRGSRTSRPSGGSGRGSWAAAANRRCGRGPRPPRPPDRPSNSPVRRSPWRVHPFSSRSKYSQRY